jgi:hypothetical protein
MIWLLASLSTAHADCPWTKVESVTATMTSVTINGQYYPVKGSAARGMFVSMLVQCKASPMAIDAFQDWRSMRQATNITAGVGLCTSVLFVPLWLAAPVTAVIAGQKKEDLIVALLQPPQS